LIADALETQKRLSGQCDLVGAVDVRLEGTVDYTDLSSFHAYMEGKESDQNVMMEALSLFSSGGWKFWQRMGFEPNRLVMGALRMQKILPYSVPVEMDTDTYMEPALPTRRSTRKSIVPKPLV